MIIFLRLKYKRDIIWSGLVKYWYLIGSGKERAVRLKQLWPCMEGSLFVLLPHQDLDHLL